MAALSLGFRYGLDSLTTSQVVIWFCSANVGESEWQLYQECVGSIHSFTCKRKAKRVVK